MNQKSKNIKLLIIWLALVVVTAGFFAFDSLKSNKTNLDKQLFKLDDPAQISTIKLVSKNSENILSQSNGQWTVNGRYGLDEGMREVLFAIFDRAKPQRKLSDKLAEEVMQQLADTSVSVTVQWQSGKEFQFQVGGDFNNQTSYFAKDGNVYLMNIPGYQSYVAGMFAVSENDWRNRITFDSHWQSMQSITVDFPAMPEKSFQLYYEKGLFTLAKEGVKDTARIMNYMEANSYQYADRFLTKEEAAAYLALPDEQILARITLQEFNKEDTYEMSIYHLQPNDRMHFAFDGQDNWMLISQRRVQAILADPSTFLK